MTAPVVVAPREIADYAYRSMRVRGLSHGVAGAVAANASTSAAVFPMALGTLVRAIELDKVVCGATVASSLLRQPEPRPVNACRADLVQLAADLGRLGSLLLVDGLHPTQWLSQSEACTDSPIDVALVEGDGREAVDQIEDARVRAARNGITVDRQVWEHLVQLAAPYLVLEHELDALESP